VAHRNASGTLRWNQVILGRLFSKATAATSDYDYRLEFPFASDDSISWVARIRSTDVKVDEVLHFSSGNALEFGLQTTWHEFRPGEVKPRGANSSITPKKIEARHGIASAAYLGQEVEFGSLLSLRYGLRLSSFKRRGAATIRRYVNDAPVAYNALR